MNLPDPETFGERTTPLPYERIDSDDYKPLTEFTHGSD
jgi:hypothetical protein